MANLSNSIDYFLIKYIYDKLSKLEAGDVGLRNIIQFGRNKIFWTNLYMAIEINHNDTLLNNFGNISLSKYNIPSERVIKDESFDNFFKLNNSVTLDLDEDFYRLDSQNVLKVSTDSTLVHIHRTWYKVNLLSPIIEMFKKLSSDNVQINYFTEQSSLAKFYAEVFDNEFSKEIPKLRIALMPVDLRKKKK